VTTAFRQYVIDPVVNETGLGFWSSEDININAFCREPFTCRLDSTYHMCMDPRRESGLPARLARRESAAMSSITSTFEATLLIKFERHLSLGLVFSWR